MTEPIWLDSRDVLAIHAKQLESFGGARGVRDLGLLESAVACPMHRPTSDPDCDLFDLAAAYVHGIVRNHPFVDGNKRAAFMAGYVFLGINGWRLEAGEPEVVLMMLALAAGDLSEEDFANWLRKSCKLRALGSESASILGERRSKTTAPGGSTAASESSCPGKGVLASLPGAGDTTPKAFCRSANKQTA